MSHGVGKSLLIGAALIGFAFAQSANAAWSLNPFASKDKASVKECSTKTTKKSPNVIEKMAAGTKNVLDKTGEALHLKKPAPKKPPAVVAAKQRVPTPRYKEKKGLLSFLNPEKEKPKTVGEWIGQTKQSTP